MCCLLVGMSRNEDNFMREERGQCSGSCRSREAGRGQSQGDRTCDGVDRDATGLVGLVIQRWGNSCVVTSIFEK